MFFYVGDRGSHTVTRLRHPDITRPLIDKSTTLLSSHVDIHIFSLHHTSHNIKIMSSKILILAINAGSSSVKLSLYSSLTQNPNSRVPKLILKSSISNLTSPPTVFKYTHASSSSSSSPSNVDSKELPGIKSQEDGFKHFLDHLSSDPELKQVSSGKDIAFACHRIVHGGDYEKPILLGQENLDYLKELTDLAPL